MPRLASEVREDIETLLKSIRSDWLELAASSVAAEERSQIRSHVQWAYDELGRLLTELDAASG